MGLLSIIKRVFCCVSDNDDDEPSFYSPTPMSETYSYARSMGPPSRPPPPPPSVPVMSFTGAHNLHARAATFAGGPNWNVTLPKNFMDTFPFTSVLGPYPAGARRLGVPSQRVNVRDVCFSGSQGSFSRHSSVRSGSSSVYSDYP